MCGPWPPRADAAEYRHEQNKSQRICNGDQGDKTRAVTQDRERGQEGLSKRVTVEKKLGALKHESRNI